MKFIKILNVEMLSISIETLLVKINTGILFTPNVDHLVKLQNDIQFYNAYQQANWVICDSKIIAIAARFLGSSFKEVIPGSSFFPAYYEYHKNNLGVKIFLLGATEGVAQKAMENINYKVGRNIIVGAHSPSFGFENNEEECNTIVNIINESGANVLVVGVGAPKQEKWIVKYKSLLPKINLFMALGATIDFEAGHIQRAPQLMQKWHLEWLFRLWKEPKRLWKRYLIDDIPFLFLVLKQKMNFYKDPFNHAK